jgi:hypothetical protein
VLIQLTADDPIPGLLALLSGESYEPERTDIIAALAKHKDDRVVKELEKIARTSDSAFMRREAIGGLAKIGNRAALLALAALLNLKFSKELKAEWGWKGPPDFSIYLPKTIVARLKHITGQTFGQDRQQWENWITENVKN